FAQWPISGMWRTSKPRHQQVFLARLKARGQEHKLYAGFARLVRVMKRLFLLRHGKAQPADGSVEDFERTLLLSGMQDASAMARYLRKGDYKLDLILCSSSARTTQTGELV